MSDQKKLLEATFFCEFTDEQGIHWFHQLGSIGEWVDDDDDKIKRLIESEAKCFLCLDVFPKPTGPYNCHIELRETPEKLVAKVTLSPK